MDVKVNQIPALTWNWLRMNELTVKEVKALQGESSVSYSTPAGIVEKSNQDFTIDTKTGKRRIHRSFIFLGNNVLQDATSAAAPAVLSEEIK